MSEKSKEKTLKRFNRNKTQDKKRKKHPKLRLAMKIMLLLFLLVVLAGMIVFYVKFGDDLIKWKAEAKEAVKESTTDTFRSSETSFIYASNKTPIAKLVQERDAYYLTFEEIPQYVKDCFIVTEDRDFYEHDGVNFLSTIKAAVLLVESRIKGTKISRGGSTITQQLARKVFLYDDQTYERKIREMFYAMELEKKYTKDQILEFYINNIYFQNGKYGIEAASRAYFSKSVSELDLSEIAFLCTTPNRPNYYNPLDEEGFTHMIERRGRILEQLLSQNKISESEYSTAVSEEIILNPAESIKTQDYMTTYAINCAVKSLMEQQGFAFRYEFQNSTDQKKYEEEYDELYQECKDNLYNGGYRIYTSLSKAKQTKLQKQINETLSGFKEKTDEGIFKLQGAATCIDNETGFVVAIVGGRKQNTSTKYTLNRAYQSYRQPGSCFKPLVVYTPCLERDYTPDSIVDDTYFKDGPRNSDNSYLGKIPLRRAVEKSRNVVAWRLYDELSPKVGLSYVLKMNFANIVSDDYYLASSLGGLTNGATTVEMASAYATIANDGIFRAPTCIKKITDSEGNVILKNTGTKRVEKQVYEKKASREMADILTGVLVRGTGAGHQLTDMACAGKTGTTSDKKDGWFCGFTPYYTTAVWVGYDSPKTLDDLYGNTYPLRIWEPFMNQIHEGLEYKDFPSPYEDENGDDDDSSSRKDDKPVATPDVNIDPEAEKIVDDGNDEEEDTPTKAPKVTKAPKATKIPEPDPTDPPITDNPEEGSGDNPGGDGTGGEDDPVIGDDPMQNDGETE
ncbi:MAG: transglycosylase domain-containing protein [Lachnospiraceae bacterium]|nr:transglycosylase domain-containing protein [Lachnospiraceae bacterium]